MGFPGPLELLIIAIILLLFVGIPIAAVIAVILVLYLTRRNDRQ